MLMVRGGGSGSGNRSPCGRANSREGMIKSLFGWVGFAGGVYYSAIVGVCEWRMGGGETRRAMWKSL